MAAGGENAGEVYARSVDKVLGPTLRGTDGTFGVITMTDGTISSVGCTWALPAVWPGSVYSLEIGIVGTEGVLTIDDTHRGRGPRPPDAHQGHGPLRGKKMRHPAAHYSEGPATVGARAMGAMASSSWVSRGGRG